jgi:Uma2 family endonuclease
MTADAVALSMPAVVTLDDLAAMNAADTKGHRYETSPEGMLSVMPPPDSEHAKIATRLMFWLAGGGWPSEQILQAAGIRIPTAGGVGGRIPDLTVWDEPVPDAIWLTPNGLTLVIEIVSPGSRSLDVSIKLDEYATAGIPHYWVVDRDAAQSVTLHRRAGDSYVVQAKMPLAWLLQTSPKDHLGETPN